MARSRYIKPGIMCNEDIAELGPYAYILFTGLWMIADREGRLEDRPKRIKAEVMPLWDDVCWKDVDNLLSGLAERASLLRYEIRGKRYIQITNWAKHQNPHVRESPSEIPPPPVSADTPDTSEQAQPRQCSGTTLAMPSPVGNGEWVMGNISSSSPPAAPEFDDEENPPPIPPTPKPTPVPPPPPKPKPAARAMAPTRHKAEDVELIRESLRQLSIETRMPAPDDDLVRKVLDAAGGASGDEIHGVLVALYKRNKFRSMYSWGFVPLVISQVFKAA